MLTWLHVPVVFYRLPNFLLNACQLKFRETRYLSSLALCPQLWHKFTFTCDSFSQALMQSDLKSENQGAADTTNRVSLHQKWWTRSKRLLMQIPSPWPRSLRPWSFPARSTARYIQKHGGAAEQGGVNDHGIDFLSPALIFPPSLLLHAVLSSLRWRDQGRSSDFISLNTNIYSWDLHMCFVNSICIRQMDSYVKNNLHVLWGLGTVVTTLVHSSGINLITGHVYWRNVALTKWLQQKLWNMIIFIIIMTFLC